MNNITIPENIDKRIVEDEEKKQWKKLIEQIYRRNVIPVIGPYWDGPDYATTEMDIVSAIAKECGMEPGQCNSFSQLINSRQYKSKFGMPDSVYSLISGIMESNKFPENKSLKEFLSMPYFPFVITTTSDPSVENVMSTIHGKSLRIMTFDNDARTNDDIVPNELDLTQPTIYYIFGKANNEGRKFVVTDYDLLNFSRSWLAETDSGCKAKPVNLAHALSKKYLLVLGCEYQSWLFKFFWYAMKDRELVTGTDTIGMMVSPNVDEELVNFLTNSHTFTKSISAANLAKTIKSKIEEYITANKPSKFDFPENGCDIFISYSRADSQVSEKMYEILTAKGFNVWYDKKNLLAGDEFLKEIRKSIRTAKLFVPILTSNISRQYNEEHVYRKEWDWAVDSYKLRGKVRYIVPFCEKEFDMYDYMADIPHTIGDMNAFEYDPSNMENNIKSFADTIEKIIR